MPNLFIWLKLQTPERHKMVQTTQPIIYNLIPVLVKSHEEWTQKELRATKSHCFSKTLLHEYSAACCGCNTWRLHVCALHKESQGQCTVTDVSHCILKKLVSFCINLCSHTQGEDRGRRKIIRTRRVSFLFFALGKLLKNGKSLDTCTV